MIARTAARELMRNWRVWLGALIVMISATAGLYAIMLHIGTAVSLPPSQGRPILSLAYGEFAFTALAAITATASTVGYAVSETRTGYARLQLAGVLPRQVAVAVILQLLISGVLGTVLGIGLGSVIAQPLLDLTVSQTSIEGQVLVGYGAEQLVTAVVMMMSIILLGGLRSVLMAGRVPVIQALRSDETGQKRLISPMRWVMVALLVGLATAISSGILTAQPGARPERISMDISLVIGLGMLLGIVILGLFAILAPLLTSVFVGLWTTVVPAKLSVSWGIARNTIRYNGKRSAATLTPILVGVGLPGLLYTIFLTATAVLGGSMSGSTEINSGAITVFLAPALGLSALGAVTIVFMSGMTRRRDHALLVINGARSNVVIRIAVLESVIYVLSASALALLLMLGVGSIVATGLSGGTWGTAPTLGLGAVLVAALAAWVLLLLVSVLPAAMASRKNLTQILVQNAE